MGIYETGSRGERRLAQRLREEGRDVRASDRKTFDLIVDGKYAEVKTSDGPYSRLGFIGLTDAQFRALKAGVDFKVFLVCNAKTPENLEIREFDATELLKVPPKVECTYYWYRSHLDTCGQAAKADVRSSPVVTEPSQKQGMSAPVDSVAVTVRIRRLSKDPGADLYVAFPAAESDRLAAFESIRVGVRIREHVVIGILKVRGATIWLAPERDIGNAGISRQLRSAGLKHGDDVAATIAQA